MESERSPVANEKHVLLGLSQKREPFIQSSPKELEENRSHESNYVDIARIM